MRIEEKLDGLGRAYVSCALALDAHDPGYVDAYFGPSDLKEAASGQPRSVKDLIERMESLLVELKSLDVPEALQRRSAYLRAQSEALLALAGILDGDKMGFDEESETLFGVRARGLSDTERSRLLAELDALLPGRGDVASRYGRYVERFRVPPTLIAPLMDAMLAESRARVGRHLDLPPERFTVEMVESAPWEAYNWYLGEGQSRIDINVGLPVSAERILLYACHEAYPGHHCMWVMRERVLVRERGWIECSVLPIRSPLALVAEGAAQYGVEMVFPAEEKAAYYRECLFPPLGIGKEEAETYERISAIANELMFRGWIGTTREFVEGRKDKIETLEDMCRYQLLARETARQYLLFMEAYRSYVINYSAGYDLVANYVRRHDDRWAAFRHVLAEPVTIPELRG